MKSNYLCKLLIKKSYKMKEFFNIKNEQAFLGGQNVHNLIIITGLSLLVWKAFKK